MAVDDYLSIGPEVELGVDRLKKVDSLKHPDLKEVGGHLVEKKKAGYQEALVEWLAHDIK